MNNTRKDYLKTMQILFDKDYKNIVSREDCCQYRGKDDRFCLATTHTKCRGCKFFTPTTQSQIKIIVEKVKELKGKIKSREMTITKLQNEIARLNEILDQKEDRISGLVEQLSMAAEELMEYKEKVYELQSESDNKD